MPVVPHPVIIVPGGMGSKLFDHHPGPHENWLSLLRVIVRNLLSRLLDPGFHRPPGHFWDDLLWVPDPPNLVRVLLNRGLLDLPDQGQLVEPLEIIDCVLHFPGLPNYDVYNKLIAYLESLGFVGEQTLFTCPYDWRLPLEQAVVALERCIERARRVVGPDAKFVFIAHSMGGPLTRYYVEVLGHQADVEKLILMGTPNQGTPYLFKLLVQGFGVGMPNVDPMLKSLSRQVVRSFPGLYELLPIYDCFLTDSDDQPVDVFTERSWLPDECHEHLAKAQAFYQQMPQNSSVPVVGIIGSELPTLTHLTVPRQNGQLKWEEIEFTLQPESGDGTVPTISAELSGPNVRNYRYNNVDHGMLISAPEVHFCLRQELLGPLAAPMAVEPEGARPVLRVHPTQTHYPLGQPIILKATLSQANGTPLSGAQVTAHLEPWNVDASFSERDDAPGTYTAQVATACPANLRVVTTAEAPDGTSAQTITLVSVYDPREMKSLEKKLRQALAAAGER
jgi:pimeloyl-ACP methyl ester carboxylesterase